MKRYITCAALGWVLGNTEGIAAVSIMIVHQPEDQAVREKRHATFKAVADVVAPDTSTSLTYQWQRQGPWATNYADIHGATNRSYSIKKVSTNDVAYYRLKVSSTNGVSYSEGAQLLVWTKHSPLTVYGSPVISSGGSGDCPAAYVAYVNYRKSATAGWGWVADHGLGNITHSATDRNFTDTQVQAVGIIDDRFCQPTAVPNTHPGAPSPEDITNRFTIYFRVSHTSPNPYPLTLDGYKP